MRNILLLAFLILSATLISCTSENNPSVGFVSAEQFEGFEWHIGTDEFVKLVTDLDEAWKVYDFEEMSPFFSDTVNIITYDGLEFDSFEAFAENIEQDPNEYKWELTSVYSVDLNPETGGEHVHANFAIESTDPSGDIDSYFLHEHYYIIDGKIIWLHQYKRDNLD